MLTKDAVLKYIRQKKSQILSEKYDKTSDSAPSVDDKDDKEEMDESEAEKQAEQDALEIDPEQAEETADRFAMQDEEPADKINDLDIVEQLFDEQNVNKPGIKGAVAGSLKKGLMNRATKKV